MEGLISPYYEYNSAVTGWGQYPRFRVLKRPMKIPELKVMFGGSNIPESLQEDCRDSEMNAKNATHP